MRLRRLLVLGVAALATALAAALGAPTAGAQEPGSATVVPIQVTGPPSERLNLVIMSDGYQADEIDKFRADVDRNLNVQWSIEPFRSYRHYFNIYRLEIVSQDSGISCDPDDGNVRRNTPLRLNFANTCPADPLARGVTYGPALTPGTGCPALNAPGCTGTQQHNLFLSTYLAPLGVSGQNVQTLALANTFTYGGIGGTQATTSGGSPQGPLISTHELGHSLGQLADEYPYSSRDVVKPCYTGGEPGSFHHTIRTSVEDMIATQHKWWRWIGEESLSGGVIGLWEGGNTFPCGVRRPSQHSMMRWLGFYFDQVGRENMTYRITGRRNANAMALANTPLGQVGPEDVVWVETQHPKYHELTVTWRVNGAVVPGTSNSRNLDLATLNVAAGDLVSVTVQDETDFVRDPAFKNGPRLTQTREWTVGAPLAATPVSAAFTISTPTDRPVGYDEVVFVETTHPTDRVLDVTWRLDGVVVPNPANSRNFDLGARSLSPGTHTLAATVTDPAGRHDGDADVDRRQRAPDRAARALRAADHALEGGHAQRVLRRVRHGARPDRRPARVRRRRVPAERRRLVQLLRLPRAARGDAVHVLALGQEREGAHVRQPRHGRAVEGDLRAVVHERPSERWLRAGLRHAHRRAPRDRRGRQHRRRRAVQGDRAARRLPRLHENAQRADEREGRRLERGDVRGRHRQRRHHRSARRLARGRRRVEDQRRAQGRRRDGRARLRRRT